MDAAVRAAALGADFIQVGTMFSTQSHPGKEPEGPGMLRQVASTVRAHAKDGHPPPFLIAVGGINERNCAETVLAGADGVAVISAISSSSDPAHAAKCIKSTMRKAEGS